MVRNRQRVVKQNKKKYTCYTAELIGAEVFFKKIIAPRLNNTMCDYYNANLTAIHSPGKVKHTLLT
jgi:hypothetical protein